MSCSCEVEGVKAGVWALLPPPPLPGQMLGILELQHGTFRKLEGTLFRGPFS